MQEPHIVRPPHVVGGEPIDYRIVIPTRGRWKEARLISKERELSTVTTPFILVKTLGFLKRQRVDPRRVSLWTADDSEKAKYQEVLQLDEYWAGNHVQICVGVPGIMHQRNHIVKALPVNTYVVSLDDDLANVFWKKDAGIKDPLVPLPDGSLEPLIFHAYALMKQYKAWIWGLATTAAKNPRAMWMDGVSTRNGEINGFIYGFINRHEPCLLPQVSDATEDAERSLRYFHKDRILLRYRMYCGDTKCFAFEEGLQGLFDAVSLKEKNVQRQSAQWFAANELHDMFPTMTGPPQEKKGTSTLVIQFRACGGFVVPTSTAAALSYANEAEKASGRYGNAKENKATNSNSSEAGSPIIEKSNATGSPASKVSKKPRAGFGSKSRQTMATPKSGRKPRTPNTDPHSPTHTLRSPSSSLDEFACMIEIDSDEEQFGADENAEFERVFARSSKAPSGASSSAQARTTSQEEEAQMIRRALEESLRDMILVINGPSADPWADAIAESQEMYQREQHRTRSEEEQLAASLENSCDEVEKTQLERSVSISDSQYGEHMKGGMSSTSHESPAPKRPRKGTEGMGDNLTMPSDYGHLVNLQRLAEMGFDRHAAQDALRDAKGDMELATAILLSCAAS